MHICVSDFKCEDSRNNQSYLGFKNKGKISVSENFALQFASPFSFRHKVFH